METFFIVSICISVSWCQVEAGKGLRPVEVRLSTVDRLPRCEVGDHRLVTTLVEVSLYVVGDLRAPDEPEDAPADLDRDPEALDPLSLLKDYVPTLAGSSPYLQVILGGQWLALLSTEAMRGIASPDAIELEVVVPILTRHTKESLHATVQVDPASVL